MLSDAIGAITTSLKVALNQLVNIKQLGERIENKISIGADELITIVGNDKQFTYVVLGNEYISEIPRVHICVPINDRNWKGKNLYPYKSVASIKLMLSNDYTVHTIEYSSIMDKKVLKPSLRAAFCKWLTSNNDGTFDNEKINAIECIKAYIKNNPECMANNNYLKFVKD